MSNTSTPKRATPKGKKESWLWDEDRWILSTDRNCFIVPHRNTVSGLKLTFDKGDEVPDFAISSELRNDLVYMSPETMAKCELCLGDLVQVTLTDDVFPSIVWPKSQLRHSCMIPSITLRGQYKDGYKEPVDVMKVTSGVIVPDLVKCKVLRPASSAQINESENRHLCEYLGRVFTGKYLMDKQVHKAVFAGRRIQIHFILDDAEVEEKLRRLSLSGRRIYKIGTKTKFAIDGAQSTSKDAQAAIDPDCFADRLIETVHREIITPLMHFTQLPLRPSRGFILFGQSGVGKTEILRLISDSLRSKFSIVWIKNSDDFGAALARISEGSVVFCLDNFENFCSKETAKNFTRDFIEAIDDAPDGRFFITSTNRMDLVDERLRTNGRLEVEVEVPVPGPDERRKILKYLSSKLPMDEINIDKLSSRLHGFVPSDIYSLMKKSYAESISTSVSLSDDLVNRFSKLVVPSAMKTMSVSVQPVKWADIGGGDRLRKSLVQLVEWPLKYAAEMKKLKITPPRGVLLYGPPGCSKTMVAKALATESDLKFLTIKGAELLSKYVGESEKAVRHVFQKARQSAPSILFFDEIDAVAVTRGAQNSVVTDRMITTLLTELDGITDDAEVSPVILIAATNRPHMIDSALLRPGRIDRFEYVPLPDADTRIDILRKVLPAGFQEGELRHLSELMAGYSGAEIVSTKQEAALVVMERVISGVVDATITVNDIELVLERIKPRTKQSDLELFRDFARAHGQEISTDEL